MISGQRTKAYVMIDPQVLTATDKKITGEIDTLGFDYCDIFLMQAAPTASNTALVMGLLAILDATSAGGTGTAVSAFANSSYSAAATVNEHHQFHVDCRGLERYLQVNGTFEGGTTTYVSAIGVLSRADVDPTNAATAGARTRSVG